MGKPVVVWHMVKVLDLITKNCTVQATQVFRGSSKSQQSVKRSQPVERY